MSVKPILFNTDMVRAILDGRKTVTRRLIKPQPPNTCPHCMYVHRDYIYDNNAHNIYCAGCGEPLYNGGFPYRAPYQPGDILYVRETFDYLEGWKIGDPGIEGKYFYRADGDLRPISWRGNWHPSIHMPKEAARIWLKVKDVRVERLQEITWQEAAKEGCYGGTSDEPDPLFHLPTLRGEFQKLWNSTIKKSELERYGWDASPWVWVIEFERCEKPE